MRIVHSTPEYRLVIPGKAESFRTPSAKKYKAKVRHSAKDVFEHPLDGPVEMRIDYFHTKNRRMDMDNVAKCIMDALNGLAYQDDKAVRLQKSTSHDLRKHLMIWDAVDIIKPLMKHPEYVFVRIRDVNS